MSLTERRPGHQVLTLADLEALPELPGCKYELIEGVIIVSPAPVPLHQRVIAHLFEMLLRLRPSGFEVFPSPLDIELPDGSRVQPDLLLVPVPDDPRRRVRAIPLLAVEVLSPSNRRYDLVWKRDAYARLGIPHYWIVDPDGLHIQCLELDGDGYTEVASGPVVTVERPVAATVDVPKLVAPPE